jgi:hypothetical protein
VTSAIETSSINDEKLDVPVGAGRRVIGSGTGSAALYLANACSNKILAFSARIPVASIFRNQESPRYGCKTIIYWQREEMRSERALPVASILY